MNCTSIRIRVGGKTAGVGVEDTTQSKGVTLGAPVRFLKFGPLKMHLYILGQRHRQRNHAK